MHLRDGAALASVVKFTAERFGRAIVMPNLKPPVATTALGRAPICSASCGAARGQRDSNRS